MVQPGAMTLTIGTRPAVDALRRIDELAGAGKLTVADLYQVTGPAAGFVHFALEWRVAADGALVLHPSLWLSNLITVAGER